MSCDGHSFEERRLQKFPRIIEEEGKNQDVGLGLIKKAFDSLTAAHHGAVAHHPLSWLEGNRGAGIRYARKGILSPLAEMCDDCFQAPSTMRWLWALLANTLFTRHACAGRASGRNSALRLTPARWGEHGAYCPSAATWNSVPTIALIMATIAVLVIPVTLILAVTALLPVLAVPGIGRAIAMIAVGPCGRLVPPCYLTENASEPPNSPASADPRQRSL